MCAHELGLVLLAVILAARTPGESTQSATFAPQPPPYKMHRQDEDWSMMRDPSRRVDWSDNLKYLPLGKRERWYASVGGETQSRYERYINEQWGSQPLDRSGYYLQRFMLHGDFHLGERVRLFGQIISGIEAGRRGGPRPADEDLLDVHQLFADFVRNFTSERSATLRIGYQELEYGSGRLISMREGRNVRQSFAGAKFMLRTAEWSIDSFAVKPVATPNGVFDDTAISSDTLWGIYSNRKLKMFSEGNIDLYYIGNDRRNATFDQGSGRESRQTLGVRLSGEPGRWDFNNELIYQFGSFGSGDIRAWGMAVDVGYTLEGVRFSSRLNLRANAASGDRDPNDPDLETFNPLFPRGAYFGQLISLGPLNFRNLHPRLELALSRDVLLAGDWVFFWRQSIMDGVYGIPGNLLRTGQLSRARFIAHEPGAEIRVSINRHMDITVNYARSFAGPFLRETPPGENTSFVAAWLTYKF
jgi:hypothetical protein